MNDSDLPRSVDSLTKKLPSERFASAGEVSDLCQQLIRADDPRAKNRAKIQGLIDGNRPYQPSTLISNGQGWRANVNYREAEGIIQAQRTPYYDLIVEVQPCVQLEIDYGSDQQAIAWAQIVAEEFHRTQFGWAGFDWHAQLQQSEMLTHGWGTHLYLSKYDWRPATRLMRHVLFPNQTTSALDDGLEYFMVREPKKAHELHRCTTPGAQRLGWKKDAILKSLVGASQLSTRKTPETIQQRLKNGDLGYSCSDSRDVWLNHLLVREFDDGEMRGGISHYIVEEDGEDYLFTKRSRFKDWDEIVSLFPYDIGSDGTIHSIRGMGARIFAFCELFNRVTNHMVDSVLVGSSVLLTSQSPVDITKLNLVSLGPMKLLPPGVNPANWKAMDLGQGPLALKRDLQDSMMENNKVYRQTVSDGSERERTATEATINQADSAKLQKSSHNMYYRALSRDYRIRLFRMCNPNYTDRMPGGREAVEFQRRCIKRGVPKAALSRIVTVEAMRSLGMGSASQRLLATQQLMNVLYPITADEGARNHMKQDWAAANLGYSSVKRYVPDLREAMIPNSEDSIAVLENDALLRGGEAIVTANNDHVKHLTRHLSKGGELLQGVEQGQADPQQVLVAWDALGPHCAGHLTYLSRDPTRKAEFQAFNQQFNQMASMADKLRQHLQEQEEAAAADAALNPQPNGANGDPEFALRMKELEDDYNLKKEKMMLDHSEKQKKNDASIAMNVRKQDDKVQLTREKQASDAAIKRKSLRQTNRNGKSSE